VDSPWKIIDELNRLSPYAQNILLSLLAESSVKYHNESKRLSSFALYATMNPKDEGNFIMSLPFLDRFALALPITMPDYESLSTIGKKEKTLEQDILPEYLKGFELKNVQDEVKSITYTEDAELFINVIISSYRLCNRMSKESNDIITVENTLCSGCHFDTPEKVCNKIIHPLSVRVKEDLYRYGKAIAWYLGDHEVKVEYIKSLAPYMIWHRSGISKKYKKELRDVRFNNKENQGNEFLNNNFFINLELEATKEIICKIEAEFEGMKSLLKKFSNIKKGKLTNKEVDDFINQIEQSNYNFLIIKKEIFPVLKNEYQHIYQEIVEYNHKIENATKLDTLNKIKAEISTRYDIPNRQFLTDIIEKKRRKIGSESAREEKFHIPFDYIKKGVNDECPDLDKLIHRKFRSEFNPAIRKEEVLADIGDLDFTLKMQKVVKGDGKYNLLFNYLGDKENPIYKFLKEKNVAE